MTMRLPVLQARSVPSASRGPPARNSTLIIGIFTLYDNHNLIQIGNRHGWPVVIGFAVFFAGMLATKLAPRYGLDRSIRGGLFVTATGSIAMLLVSLYSPAP